jgi:hypothetical protein
MIPARIIEITDKVVVEYWKLPKPNIENVHDSFTPNFKGYRIAYRRYMQSRTIAEVENAEMSMNFIEHVIEMNDDLYCHLFKIGEQVFIEPTSEGKCKIIKI